MLDALQVSMHPNVGQDMGGTRTIIGTRDSVTTIGGASFGDLSHGSYTVHLSSNDHHETSRLIYPLQVFKT